MAALSFSSENSPDQAFITVGVLFVAIEDVSLFGVSLFDVSVFDVCVS
jgi:hypothetical protein